MLVHLDVREPNGRARGDARVSFGVPFAAGVVSSVDELSTWTADGVSLPSQARQLSLWRVSS